MGYNGKNTFARELEGAGMENRKPVVGVIAGTPVDTQMGVDYVVHQGCRALGFACSADAAAQNEMQILHRDELLQIAIAGCRDMAAQGAQGIFVHCNSLSGAIDLTALRRALSVPVVTPLDIYDACARRYDRLAVLAANGQSLSAIERTVLAANPRCAVFGAGILPLVQAIETGAAAQEICERLSIVPLCRALEAMDCRALILGCTHYPYIAEVLRGALHVPVIDPAGEMLHLLLETVERRV